MTNSEIAQRQAEIDARVAAATQGEWEQNRRSVECDGEPLMYAHNGEPYFNSFEDAEFIAHAKPDLEWLSERVKALAAEIAERIRITNSLFIDRFVDSYTIKERGRRISEKDSRIAALENAARSCATCLYHVSDLDPIPDYCNANCRKPDIRGAGWVFDEKRWANKEGSR